MGQSPLPVRQNIVPVRAFTFAFMPFLIQP
jgi:hypothetical protein